MAIKPACPEKGRLFYGYIVVAASLVVMATMWGIYYSFGVFFKPLLDEFGWARAVTSGVFSVSLIVVGFLCIVAGRLTDRFGPRLVVTICGLFLGIGYILVSLVSSVWHLYLFYGVIISIGMSGAYVPLVSTVARWFVKKRGMMTGLAVSGLGLGTLIMPLVANWLISNHGWRFSFRVVGAVALVIVPLTAQLLRRDPGRMRQLPCGAGELGEHHSSSRSGFSFREAILTKQFWMLSIAVICFTITLGTVLVHVVPHAIGLRIHTTTAVGILAIIGGVSIGGRVLMGSAYDRISNKLALTVCFVFLLVSTVLLLMAKDLKMLYLFATLFALGYGGVSAIMSPTVAQLFGLASHGAIMGTINMFAESGSAIGSVLAGYIFDVTGSYRTAFLLCAVLSTIGLVLIRLVEPVSSAET